MFAIAKVTQDQAVLVTPVLAVPHTMDREVPLILVQVVLAMLVQVEIDIRVLEVLHMMDQEVLLIQVLAVLRMMDQGGRVTLVLAVLRMMDQEGRVTLDLAETAGIAQQYVNDTAFFHSTIFMGIISAENGDFLKNYLLYLPSEGRGRTVESCRVRH